MSARAEAARRRKEKLLARGGDRLAAITGTLPPTEPAKTISAEASTAAGLDSPECSSTSEPVAIPEHPASLGVSEPSTVAGQQPRPRCTLPRAHDRAPCFGRGFHTSTLPNFAPFFIPSFASLWLSRRPPKQLEVASLNPCVVKARACSHSGPIYP